MNSTGILSRRTWVIGAVIALTISLLTAVGSSPATAYPPGQSLTLAATHVQVLRGKTVGFRALHASPGKVRFYFGDETKTVNVKSDYSTPWVYFTARYHKTYWVRAVELGDTKAVALKKLYVPRLILPANAPLDARRFIELRNARPGAPISMTVSRRTFYGTVGADALARVAFRAKARGWQAVRVTVGTLVLPTRYIWIY